MDETQWLAPIARWSFWDASVREEATPDLGFIAPIVRRRLSPLARMTLRVAHDCAQDHPDARMVFASRHGEISRTTALLEQLAVGEALSPTAFSTSVLIAGAGLFSILQSNKAPATAISAGDESFAYGLLEACSQLASIPQSPVLLVYADECLPSVYVDADAETTSARALGLLLATGASTQVLCSRSDSAALPSDEAQVLAFLRCLDSVESVWCGNAQCWRWARQ